MKFKNWNSKIKIILLKLEAHHKEYHIKISQFTTFGDVSIDFNHVEGFQKSETLETLCGFEGRHIWNSGHLYEIWVTFDSSQPGYYAM